MAFQLIQHVDAVGGRDNSDWLLTKQISVITERPRADNFTAIYNFLSDISIEVAINCLWCARKEMMSKCCVSVYLQS